MIDDGQSRLHIARIWQKGEAKRGTRMQGGEFMHRLYPVGGNAGT